MRLRPSPRLPMRATRTLCAALLAVSLMPALVACQPDYHLRAVSPPPVDPLAAPPGLGTICVLRPQAFGAVARALHYDNGHLVGVTQGAAVTFCYLVQPGWHDLMGYTDNEARLRVQVPPSGRVYARYTLRVGPDLLEPLAETDARSLFPRLTYVEAVPAHPGVRPLLKTPVPALGP